jgi:hypothetical protein
MCPIHIYEVEVRPMNTVTSQVKGVRIDIAVCRHVECLSNSKATYMYA